MQEFIIPILFLCTYCFALYKAYPLISDVLETRTPLFGKSNRKNYIVKNVVKGASLFVLVLLSFVLLTQGWDNTTLRVFATIYVSNDIMGFVMCEDLPTSTRIHHTTSILFLFGAMVTNFQTSHVAQMLFYYTYASALAFPVNLYLGLRLCYIKDNRPKWLQNLKQLSKWVYFFVCIISWSFQLYLLRGSLEEIIYLFMILFIVFDDIVLLKWLFSK